MTTGIYASADSKQKRKVVESAHVDVVLGSTSTP